MAPTGVAGIDSWAVSVPRAWGRNRTVTVHEAFGCRTALEQLPAVREKLFGLGLLVVGPGIVTAPMVSGPLPVLLTVTVCVGPALPTVREE